MVMLNSLQSILSILFMIFVGYVLAYKKWFNDSTSELFSKLVINISLPTLMVSTLMNSFTKDKLSQSGIGIIVPFISIIVSYFVSLIFTKLIKISPSRKGTFQCMFFLSNTIFIGLPVNLALFGEQSVPYVLYYYISNTTIFWTLGVYLIKRDAGIKDKSIFTKETLKNIFTPPLIGFLSAVVLIMLQIKLPVFIMDSFKYLGDLTTPLSMLFIGTVIYSLDFKKIKFTKEMFFVLFGRFIISPLITFGFSHLFGIPYIMRSVFVIQSGLPVMATTAIITKAYNADHEYATLMIAITTLASLVFIPIYMVIL